MIKKIEITHIGQDYYTVAVNEVEYDISFATGEMIEGILKSICKVIKK